MRITTLFTAIALPSILVGCGSGGNQPAFAELHTVKGVVKRGGQPMKGGMIKFIPDPDKPEFLINALVQSDGSFSLTTVRTTDTKGERKNGAPAGNYKVTYMPDLADQTVKDTNTYAVANFARYLSSGDEYSPFVGIEHSLAGLLA